MSNKILDNTRNTRSNGASFVMMESVSTGSAEADLVALIAGCVQSASDRGLSWATINTVLDLSKQYPKLGEQAAQLMGRPKQ